jgi:mono/diheme cytochrome c family protein
MPPVALVAALSTTSKIVLAVVGGTFIVFALVSSFVLPRRNPGCPGRSVGWFSALAILFFVAMISSVIVFGKESEEKAGAPEPTLTTNSALPGQATTTNASPAAPTGGGNAKAGKAVFASAGCSGCHTLKAAGSSGNVGPNLDQLHPSFDAVQNQVEHGGGGMPAFKGQLSDQQIKDVAAFVSSSAGS